MPTNLQPVARSTKSASDETGRRILPTRAEQLAVARRMASVEVQRAQDALDSLRALADSCDEPGAVMDVAALARRTRLAAIGVEQSRDVAYVFATIIEDVGDALRAGLFDCAEDAAVYAVDAVEAVDPDSGDRFVFEVLQELRWAIEARRDGRTQTGANARPGTRSLLAECSRGTKRAPEWIARTWRVASMTGMTTEPFGSFDSGWQAWRKAGPRKQRKR